LRNYNELIHDFTEGGLNFNIIDMLQTGRKASNDYGESGKAKIHNMSWGSGKSQDKKAYDIWCRILDDYSTEHDDFLAVVAAGNNGSIQSPAVAKNVLSGESFLLQIP